jgi:glycosyltransferase involved in cell wall biosynthesis
MAHVSVVIPVYRAADCLHELHRRLTAALRSITHDYEIVLVEDAGGDGSWEIIAELARHDPRVRGIQFSRNFGQHYGVTAGLDACDGDWVVVMDCDLQDRPEEIARLYHKAREGYDVVVARRGRRRDPWMKRATSRVFYAIFQYLTEVPYDEEVGNFRIVSRDVVRSYRLYREQLRFFAGLMTLIGFPTTTVDVEHGERFAGESSYSYRKLLQLGVDTILAYSDKPLRLAIRLGVIMSLTAFAFGVYFFIRAVTHQVSVSGWSSLIVSLFFLSGIMIGLLGVIGLYLGKTFDEAKKRPLYIIRRTTFGD